jgi:hypothetical protein
LNRQPHTNQLRNKIVKGKGDNMGKVEDMGVIGQGREETRKEKP